jgi:negative regulator of flagellin synthesis FlgM
MKVELNGGDAATLSSISSTQRGQTAAAAIAGASAEPEVGEDKATLSTDSTNIQALTAKAMESSEVRQERVEALRQAVQNGTYKIEPDKIAEAMIRQSE